MKSYTFQYIWQLTNFPHSSAQPNKYIYIYIYCHPQTDCFIVSQLFSVARPTRCFKLRSKPWWIYVSRTSCSISIVILRVSEGILYIYLSTYMLLATKRAQFVLRAMPVYIYIYVYIMIRINNCLTNQKLLKCWPGGCPRGVMVKAMGCRIIVSEFKLLLCYYVRFRANTLGKGMNPLILPTMG